MAKNEAKIKFTAETGSFNSAIQKANNEMSELRAELKLNETQMKASGDAVEGLENKHSILQRQLKASQDKTEALSQKVQKAVEIFGDNSDEASKLRTQLLNAQTAEAKLEQAVKACADELEDQRNAARDAEDATETLTDKIDRQQRELKELKSAYINAVDAYGETSDEARKLAREIEDVSGELKQSKSAFNDASDAADKLDRSMDDAGDSASDSADGFTIAKGVISDLASEAIQLAIGKISEFIGWLRELPEATREIRQDMATLETSYESVGLTTEQATETWKDLYTVFGEDDRAVEAANLIAKMSDSQQDLNDWVTITTGIFGTYQDSLPVEGLAEAAMETAKTGDVTGVLADALNWSSEAASMFSKYMGEDVTTAEEAFNVALSECTTEQERQSLITETLTALYGDAAAKFEEASGSQLAAKEATAESIIAQNNLANAIEPVTTAWEGLKTSLLVAVTPAIESVCGALETALSWLQEHPAAAQALAAAVGVLAVGIGGLAIGLGIYTAAQWLANSAMIAFVAPALGIIAVIALIVAAIVGIVVYWDEIVAACGRAWEGLKSTLSQWGEWINSNVVQPVADFFSGMWDGIVSACTSVWDSVSSAVQSAWDFICNIVQVGIMLIGSIISAAVQIITLPFRFIWENCKEYVMAAWEWIKAKVSAGINAVKNTISKVMTAVKSVFSTAWNAIKNVVSKVWNGIKSTVTSAVNAVKSKITAVWNSIKSTTSSVFNSVKSVATSAWNGVKNAVSNVVNGVKSKVSSVWNSIKSATSSAFNGIKSTASSVWNGIKSAITTPIEAAKSKVKSVVDAIKGFFSGMKLSLPKIKLPHFSVSGKLSLNPPSVPKMSISWYKDGGIFTKPTIFDTPFGLKGVGEAGAEAVLPIDRLEGYISGAIEKAQNVVSLDSLAAAIEDLASRPMVMNINGRQFATATASDGDSVNGLRSSFKSRGLALD